MINKPAQQYESKTQYGHSLSFPKGIIGFDGLNQFTLEPLSDDKTTELPFLRLQAKGQVTNFIVMPMGNPYDNSSTNPYETVDLDQWLESLELEDNKITLFALVSVKDEENKGLNVTANMRAPIIVDNESMNAWQIILDNSAYEIAYKLNIDN